MEAAGKKYKGTSFIEVLVALVIFSLILMELMNLQLVSLQSNMHAYYQTIAAIQAQSMLNRLRANQSIVNRDREYQAWNQVNQKILPEGHGHYHCEANPPICRITIHWLAKIQHVLILTGWVRGDETADSVGVQKPRF